MPDRPFVLGIGGSTRESSSSERAVATALEAAAAAGAETRLIPATSLELPMYAPERPERTDEAAEEMEAFRFFGPTCDSMDTMAGPFHLPADTGEGDWIEICHLGAYGQALATRFNGFQSETTVAVLG